MLAQLSTVWEYAGEIVAAILIHLALVLFFGVNQVSGWVFEKRVDLGIAAGIAIGLGVALFAAFIAVLCTEFGTKLRMKGEAVPYVVAFGAPILIFLLTFLSLIFVAKDVRSWYLRITSILLIYSCLNCFTVVKNMIGVISLWQDVDRSQNPGEL
jgi:hypothetical protein